VPRPAVDQFLNVSIVKRCVLKKNSKLEKNAVLLITIQPITNHHAQLLERGLWHFCKGKVPLGLVAAAM